MWMGILGYSTANWFLEAMQSFAILKNPGSEYSSSRSLTPPVSVSSTGSTVKSPTIILAIAEIMYEKTPIWEKGDRI